MAPHDRLVPELLDRYARYHALLGEVSEAIEARAQDTLLILETACNHVLQDIQGQWTELESRMQTRPFDGGTAETSWALLDAAMVRAAEQLSLNHAALEQWAGEVAATLQDAKVRGAVLGAYEAVADGDAGAFGAPR